MTNQPVISSMSAEQLMLSKMDNMRAQIQPEFVVSANPLDVQKLNEPLSFSTAMTQVLDTVNQHQSAASQKMTAVETGKSDDLVGAMIASQKASLSFNALMQVRNKVVSSFEDIMKMPV
ncbi:flagellar hook-basal body complex protein FliE [Vibrio ostreicida]|uniref:Flagellar hook-basal body complex protein FliE n=1 Tax=Vibrio ostreicida TaxID=526588 RepID=A0ABT8BTD3_9VIBR|nr:flagellar hook-basal body complex protein FliE [Vibrio ostreicida]MDN3609470.1 flagellar hook-basal body complex protein FliE [Vibrio ostreicida]NPD08351.1 flagellar hook-basal body complex protein FliE [Vibrio ostreicida]